VTPCCSGPRPTTPARAGHARRVRLSSSASARVAVRHTTNLEALRPRSRNESGQGGHVRFFQVVKYDHVHQMGQLEIRRRAGLPRGGRSSSSSGVGARPAGRPTGAGSSPQGRGRIAESRRAKRLELVMCWQLEWASGDAIGDVTCRCTSRPSTREGRTYCAGGQRSPERKSSKARSSRAGSAEYRSAARGGCPALERGIHRECPVLATPTAGGLARRVQ